MHGVAYAARHRALGELVALKFLLPAVVDSPGVADRFLHEARAGTRIKSPHVARVYDVGTASVLPFMVMEHLVGRDLAAILDEQPEMGVTESADLLLQACEAINEAHALGIVHRDLKPANLFVTTGTDGRPFVRGQRAQAWGLRADCPAPALETALPPRVMQPAARAA